MMWLGTKTTKAQGTRDVKTKQANELGLFDMSGNVSELCNTPFDGTLFTVCGGNYTSPADKVTTSSREGFSTNAKDKTVGFRLVIRKYVFN